MPLTNIPDLAFEIDGDLIRLRQDAGCGEEHIVDLHPLHLRHLAEQAGLLAPSPLLGMSLGLADGPDGMDGLKVQQDEDGTIVVSQACVRGMGGSDEAVVLHPLQAAWLAAKLATLVGSSEKSDAAIPVTLKTNNQPEPAA